MQVPWRPEEGILSSGAEVTGGCELLDMSAGNETRVLCKSSMRPLKNLK